MFQTIEKTSNVFHQKPLDGASEHQSHGYEHKLNHTWCPDGILK